MFKPLSVFKAALGASAIALASSAANALPIMLEFTGVAVEGYSGSTTPGVTPGDAISWTVIADNGGTSLASQSWSYTDIISTTISAGSYAATTSGAIIGGGGGFSTDGSGVLANLNFNAIQGGTDSNGVEEFLYYMNNANNIWFPDGFDWIDNFGAVSPPDISNTVISFVEAGRVPVPGVAMLLLGGLAGLISTRRKYHRK